MSAFFLFTTQRIAQDVPGQYRAYEKTEQEAGRAPLSFGAWAVATYRDEAKLTDDIKSVPGSWVYHQQYVEMVA